MPTLTERLRAAFTVFQTGPPRPLEGEIAQSDPKHLFPGGWYTQFNPSALVGRKGLRIFDAMRKDDQVKAALAFKKHAVISTGWEVRSPEGYPDDWAPTRFVRWCLQNIAGTLENDLLEILTALDFGYSVTEKVWAPVPSGEWAGMVCLQALKTRRPHEITFDADEFGNLTPDGIIQAQTSGPKRLPVEKFVLFANDMEFDNYYGQSDLEAAYRAWWTKDNAYKWLAILLERLGVPPVVAMYNPDRYTGALVEQLKSAVKNLQAATFGIMPRKSKDDLEFWAPELAGQATRVFTPAMEMFNQDIARAILMPGLLGMTADQSVGSLARAKVHFDVFMLVLAKIRIDMKTRAMKEQVIRPLVDLNFAVDAYPEWDWLPITDDVRTDLLDQWMAAVEKGTVTPQPDDEDHIRQMLSFPKKMAPSPEPPALPYARVKVFARQANRYERQVNFARIEQDLTGLETGALGEIRKLLTSSRDNLLGYVERNLSGNPAIIDTLRINGAGDIEFILREFLRSGYEVGRHTLRSELPKTLQLRGPMFTPTEALRWLSRKAIYLNGVLREKLLTEAKGVVMNALRFGEPSRDTLQKLSDLFEPYLGDPGVLRDDEAVAPYRLETMLRTNATDAFNQGRLVSARDPEIAAFVRGMEYSAVIDSRTTEVCRFLDGKVFRMSEPEMDRLSPSNHWNCRSVLVAIPVGVEIDESDFLTPAELGRAEELAGEGFK